jgi:hypothetical protein
VWTETDGRSEISENRLVVISERQKKNKKKENTKILFLILKLKFHICSSRLLSLCVYMSEESYISQKNLYPALCVDYKTYHGRIFPSVAVKCDKPYGFTSNLKQTVPYKVRLLYHFVHSSVYWLLPICCSVRNVCYPSCYRWIYAHGWKGVQEPS